MTGFYIVSLRVLSFRGPDGLYLCLGTMVKTSLETQTFVIIALREKLKGEKDERNHMFPFVEVTSSSVQVKQWRQQGLNVHLLKGRTSETLMKDSSSKPMMSREVNKLFLSLLKRIDDEDSSVFPPQVASEDVNQMGIRHAVLSDL